MLVAYTATCTQLNVTCEGQRMAKLLDVQSLTICVSSCSQLGGSTCTKTTIADGTAGRFVILCAQVAAYDSSILIRKFVTRKVMYYVLFVPLYICYCALLIVPAFSF